MSTPSPLLRDARPPFARLLKSWRETRKCSQLELALISRISQRHVSFLESGRARPSREMVLQLAESLEVPLRERNTLLTAAGFAAMYRETNLESPAMAPVREALALMLKNLEPNPATVVDRDWNVLMRNEAAFRVFSLIGDLEAMWRRVCGDGPRNILKATFHEQGFRPFIVNFEEAAPVLLNRTRREAAACGSETLLKLIDEILAYPGIPVEWRMPDWQAPPPPVLPLTLGKGDMRLDLFSMITTFGTPQDITTDELRVETFFPVDESSAQLLKALALR